MTKKETRGRKPTGITPKRYFRMPDTDYEIVKNAAEIRGVTISDYIRTVLVKNARKIIKNKSK